MLIYSVPVDFGEPEVRTRTINISEFIITGGAQEPLDGERAYGKDDIDAALADRKQKLEASKNKTKGNAATTAAKPKPNLGF